MLRCVCLMTWVVCSMPLGCATPGEARYGRFEDEDPAVRISAIIDAGNRGDRHAAGYLIDRLTDSERDVRFFAIVALEKIFGKATTEEMGYRHYAPRRRRAAAAQRWREWWRRQRGPVPTSRSSTGQQS